MPKTVEELEKELASKDGVIDGLNKQITTLTEAHSVTKAEYEAAKVKLEAVEKSERDAIEKEAHSFNEKYDCKGKSNEVIQSYIEGFKSAKQNVKAPGIPHSTEKPKSDKPKSAIGMLL